MVSSARIPYPHPVQGEGLGGGEWSGGTPCLGLSLQGPAGLPAVLWVPCASELPSLTRQGGEVEGLHQGTQLPAGQPANSEESQSTRAPRGSVRPLTP